MLFRDISKREEQQETPAIAEAIPAVMSDGAAVVVGVRLEGGTAGAECTTPEPAGPRLTASGKRRGRPSKGDTQGSWSQAAAYASHGGSRSSATGNAAMSKATRRGLRQLREGGGAGEVVALEVAAAEVTAAAAAKAKAEKPRRERGPHLLPHFVCDNPTLCAAL